MTPRSLLMSALVAIIVASCTVMPTMTPTPMIPTAVPTPGVPPRQPEPQRPLIGGQFSGLADDTLVTIHVRTLSGWEALWGTRRGNGPWESIVTEASGVDYVVTAEAEGYVNNPLSYSIHLSGTTAYVVEGEQITTEEALHLDFHFEPTAVP